MLLHRQTRAHASTSSIYAIKDPKLIEPMRAAARRGDVTKEDEASVFADLEVVAPRAAVGYSKEIAAEYKGEPGAVAPGYCMTSVNGRDRDR